MFIKKKRTGIMKAIVVADGRAQREYISIDKSSLLTARSNALFSVCVNSGSGKLKSSS